MDQEHLAYRSIEVDLGKVERRLEELLIGVVDSIVKWICFLDKLCRNPGRVANDQVDSEGHAELSGRVLIEGGSFNAVLRVPFTMVEVDDVQLDRILPLSYAEDLTIHFSRLYTPLLTVYRVDLTAEATVLADHDRQNACTASQVNHVLESRVVRCLLADVVREQAQVLLCRRCPHSIQWVYQS